MTDDINIPSGTGQPLRHYLDAIEQAAPEDKAARTDELTKAMDPTGQGVKEILGQIRQAAEGFKQIDPFIDAIFEASPGPAQWYMQQPLSVIALPIRAYMTSNGLKDGSDIEAHKAPFLRLFGEYITALERAYREEGPVFKMGPAQYKLLEATFGEGLLDRITASAQQDIIPGIELTTLTPDFIYGPYAAMPISKLIQKQGIIAKANGAIAKVDVGGEGEDKAIVEASITADIALTPEAIEIQNVIGELVQANGNRPIRVTRAQIWRAFAGLEDGAKVLPKTQEHVGDIVNGLAKGKGRIDFTQQIEKHTKIKKDSEYNYKNTVLEGPLVMRDEITMKAGGHKTKGFILYRQPLYFLHSHLTNQITRIDRALLDTTTEKITDGEGTKHAAETRNNDITFVLLKRHFARQIEHMKSEKAKSKTGAYEGRRAFDTIHEAIGIDKPTPMQARTIRADIELLCRRWEIQGHIKGHSLYQNRGSRAFAGVQIHL